MESPQKGLWYRKETTVQDETNTKSEIRVKLWGDQAKLIEDSYQGKTTEFKNVRVDRWMGIKSLGSMEETVVQVGQFQRIVVHVLPVTYMACKYHLIMHGPNPAGTVRTLYVQLVQCTYSARWEVTVCLAI